MSMATVDPHYLEQVRQVVRGANQKQVVQRDVAGSLLNYCRRMAPGFETPPHILLLIEFLERAATTPDFRGIVTMPPRHGKSYLISELFPGWVLGKYPDTRIMGSSHNEQLTNKFSRSVRNSFESKWWPFPGVRIAPDKGAVKEWAIDGSRQGGYLAVSRGSSPTGSGADILIIDDPIADEAEADSPGMMESLWEWFTVRMYTRLEPGGAVIVVATRWAADDLTGRLLESMNEPGGEQWEHLHLPAIAEPTEDEPDPLGRKEGEALWPERWPVSRLMRTMSRLPARWWNALYRGKPSSKGGNLIRVDWFPRYSRLPENATTIVQMWDTAFKTQKKHDYTVCLTAAVSPYAAYVVDVMRAKLEWPDLVKRFKSQTRAFAPAWVGIEDKASGTSLIQEAKNISGMPPIIPMPAVKDHESRANEVSPSWEAGKVELPISAYWLDEFLEELKEFPNVAHDDQVDTLSNLTYRLYYHTKMNGASSSSWIDMAIDRDDEYEDERW